MILNDKTLEYLRELINEKTEYRSGQKLVEFFNTLGFRESYGQGFPSRWIYTDNKLKEINGTPALDKCIKKVLAPINFVSKISELDNHIKELNQYLAFDKWQVVREQAEIKFIKTDKIVLTDDKVEPKEDDFLAIEFKDISLDTLQLQGNVTQILESRIDEIKKCFSSNSHLSIIIMAGSVLEGLLLGVALKLPKEFNQAGATPKNPADNKPKQFYDWTLNDFINVAYELKLLDEDVKKFSHALRDFRNFIHPFQQMSTGFNPTQHTAKICFQVLKAAIFQLSQKVK